MEALHPTLELVRDPTRAQEWSRLTVRRRATDDAGWERASAQPISGDAGPLVRLAVRTGTRETTETLEFPAWSARLEELLADEAQHLHVLGRAGTVHARRSKRGRWLASAGGQAPEGDGSPVPLGLHDRERTYALPPDHPDVRALLVATGLFSPAGRLRGEHAAKYRQVQNYVDLLRPLPVWSGTGPVRIVDAGCGKAYMSLALGAYGRVHGRAVTLTGLDSNREVVAPVAGTAAALGYDATFEATTIRAWAAANADTEIDLLVSLHACDTATDEAIAAGVNLGAGAIVVAPCCQHELATQLRRVPAATAETWDAALAHGILRGRLADILTDALRAAALEAAGYHAEVIEFVAAEHTTKNLMIRAVRRRPGPAAESAREKGRRRYATLRAAWDVEPEIGRLLPIG